MMIALTVKVADGDYRVRYGEQATFQVAQYRSFWLKPATAFVFFHVAILSFVSLL
jgi:hypothetical protein